MSITPITLVGRYILQAKIGEFDGGEPHEIYIPPELEDHWLKALGFTKGVAAQRTFDEVMEEGRIASFSWMFAEGMETQELAFAHNTILTTGDFNYVPSNAPGERLNWDPGVNISPPAPGPDYVLIWVSLQLAFSIDPGRERIIVKE